MRALALAALLAISCTAAPIVTAPSPVPTHEPNAINVTALLDLSGTRAPSGQPQRNAMQIWLDQNGTSGPVRIHVKFVDVGGSDAKLLLEFRHAAVDDRADAVVVGVPVSLDGSFGSAVQVAAIPVLLTLPVAEPVAAAGGRYAFALAPTPDDLARALVSDIVGRDLAAPMLLATDATPAAAVERGSVVAELKRRGITPPTPISLDDADAGLRVASAAAVAKSVVLLCPSASHGDELRAINVAGAPVVYLSYLTETADVTNLRDQAGIVTWPGSRTLAPLSFNAFAFQKAFVQAFTDRYGPPSTLAATAYDALGILDIAARQAPAELDALSFRVRLETGGYAGVVTRYSFTPQRHAGFSLDDLAYLRWNPQRGAPFIPPAPTSPER